MVGDSTWAATYESPPPPIHDHTWMPILQHPQPQSAQASSGTILPFHSAPISQRPATAHPSTEHLPHRPAPSSIEELRQSGISPYRSMSAHSSLYRQSRNLSPVPHAFQSLTVTTAATGQMRSSSAQDEEPISTANSGHESTDSSGQSHNLHLSYSRPLSRDTMSTSPTRLPERAPSRNSPLDPTRHSQTSPMKEQIPSRPLSRRSRQPTLALPVMTLPDAIRFYQRTATDLSVAIPEELRRAEYRELYKYYAYELPFILAWGDTQAGNDYFMKKNRGLPCDDILQYEAERNARLLYNEVHQNAPIEEFPPYEDIVVEADIQLPMPDEPPVPPPHAPIDSPYPYAQGNAPPGTYQSGYRPFAGAGSSGGGGGGQPTQPPQPPAAPQRWMLLRYPAPPKAPTPPAP